MRFQPINEVLISHQALMGEMINVHDHIPPDWFESTFDMDLNGCGQSVVLVTNEDILSKTLTLLEQNEAMTLQILDLPVVMVSNVYRRMCSQYLDWLFLMRSEVSVDLEFHFNNEKYPLMDEPIGIELERWAMSMSPSAKYYRQTIQQVFIDAREAYDEHIENDRTDLAEIELKKLKWDVRFHVAAGWYDQVEGWVKRILGLLGFFKIS